MLRPLVLTLFLFGFSGFVHASEDIPYGLCSSGLCEQKQLESFKRFIERGTGIEALAVDGVYSGTCYWNHVQPDDHEHFVGWYWYLADGEQVAFKGRFSFYAKMNPYTETTPEEAKAKWFSNPKINAPQRFATHAFYDSYPEGSGDSRLWYWFRSDVEDPTLLYMVSLAGWSQIGVCELRLNQGH